MSPLWWWPLGRVPEITPAALHAALQAGGPLQLVDVRTRPEHARGHITGARPAPIHTFRAAWPALNLDPGRPVILICRTAHRSIPATRLLQARGFDARQLTGGMNAWEAQGLPTEKQE